MGEGGGLGVWLLLLLLLRLSPALSVLNQAIGSNHDDSRWWRRCRAGERVERSYRGEHASPHTLFSSSPSEGAAFSQLECYSRSRRRVDD